MTGDVFERWTDDCIERGVMDLETGEFSAILATQGEASDGHILSIAGLEVPERMPLFFGHRSELLSPSLGSVLQPTKGRKDGVAVLRTRPRVNMNGDGIMSEIRRGMAQLIADGDLTGMSLRWKPLKTIKRTSLNPNHPAYIDASKIDSGDPRAYGHLHEKSRGKEGSVVGLGADEGALVGRSQEATNEHVRAFWRALAGSTEGGEHCADVIRGFDALESSIDGLKSLGVDDVDLANAIGGHLGGHQLRSLDYTDSDGNPQSMLLPVEAWQSVTGESLSHLRAALALRAEHDREVLATAGARDDAGVTPSDQHDEREEAGDEGSQRNSVMNMSGEDLIRGIAGTVRDQIEQAMYRRTGRIPK